MKWLILITIIGAVMTVYYAHADYRAGKTPKKIFMTFLVLDSVVVVISGLLFLAEL